MSNTALFLTIQFTISAQFSSIWPIGVTTAGQSGSGSDGNEEGLHSPTLQHYWSLTIRLFSIISRTLVKGDLPLCRDAVGVFYSSNRLGPTILKTVWGGLPYCLLLKPFPQTPHSPIPRHLELEPHYWMLFCVRPRAPSFYIRKSSPNSGNMGCVF